MHGFRRLLALLLLGLLSTGAFAEQALPAATDLQQDAREAARRGDPIVLFFAADSCHYCKTVEDLYLGPMAQDDRYRKRMLVRVVQVERDTSVRDFGGAVTTQAALAKRFGVKLTPVIKFVDDQGRELVPDLLGVSSPDFYGSYLEAAVQAAMAKMRTQSAR